MALGWTCCQARVGKDPIYSIRIRPINAGPNPKKNEREWRGERENTGGKENENGRERETGMLVLGRVLDDDANLA